MATNADDLQFATLGMRRISPDTDPQELVLPEASEQRLKRLADWLTQPPPVLREWGLHRLIDGGLRALFRGPPGTGKTMAAIAIARGTERPLLSVDMGAVVSKYIGDTEKHLRRLFAEAEEEKAILLFDEADALLGKRTGVTDSHDRYANADIGRLLRKIEPYEGLAILTTNRTGELDADAVTRLDGIVDFPMPDAAARERLWRQTLGAMKMFKTDAVDAAALARAYELSGADIVRAARIAALLAATNDQPLDMDLLKHSAEERVTMREGSNPAR
jgi:SpoVK/Ycf46/Vps4 family AAA+-type ATPase